MGRWAQRRRGSASVQLNSQNFIASIDVPDPVNGIVNVTYAEPVDASLFSGSDFTTHPGSLNPGLISQTSQNELALDFGADLTGESTLEYAGTASGVLTPQEVTF